MSRGPGALQRALWTMIRQHGKPMTFNDIRADIRKQVDKDGTKYSSLEWSLLYSSLERSLRRALQRMVRDDVVIAIGDGGRADPHRYFIHPLIIGMMGKTPEADALLQALEADPGAGVAANKAMAKMFSQNSG